MGTDFDLPIYLKVIFLFQCETVGNIPFHKKFKSSLAIHITIVPDCNSLSLAKIFSALKDMHCF